MSQSPSPNEIEEILQGLAAPEAKRREAAARLCAQQKPGDERVISRLGNLAASDQYAYVREAASGALVALGQPVPFASAPPQVGRQANTPILIVILAFIACLIVACLVVVILVITGPQIGNVFSRITNGLQ